jgi:mannosyltransferase OCH1-like enzyme
MAISKIIHQIWIGPLPPPTKWLQTWPEHNPDWEYRLWTNEDLYNEKWVLQPQIDFYLKQAENTEATGSFISARGSVYVGEKAILFAWHVIADLMRYEILYKYGGYMPGADTECTQPILKIKPDFLDQNIHSVNTGYLFKSYRRDLEGRIRGLSDWEKKLYERYAPENASPVLGAKAGHPFLKLCISELSKLKEGGLGEAVDTTGNVFMGKMLRLYGVGRLTFPKYKLKEFRQRFPEKFFSKHHSGTTKGTYANGRE